MIKKKEIQSAIISFFEKEDEFYHSQHEGYHKEHLEIQNISQALEDFYTFIENAYQDKYSFNYTETRKYSQTIPYFMNNIFHNC